MSAHIDQQNLLPEFPHNPYHKDKLQVHTEHVSALAVGELIAPLSLEVDLADGACNQSCPHCSHGSGLGNRMRFIDEALLVGAAKDAQQMGTKAVLFVGGAEPTTHPRLVPIIEQIQDLGLETAITTNGLLSERLLGLGERRLRAMTFIRTSLDTVDTGTYSILHGVPPRQHAKVMKNLGRLRHAIPREPTRRQLGIGYLVVPPHNHQESGIIRAVKTADEMGLDFVAFRPAQLEERQPEAYWEEAQLAIQSAKRMIQQSNSDMGVFGGLGVVWDVLKPDAHPTGMCDARPLVAVIQADGRVANCILERTAPDGIGNLGEQSFKDIWFSDKHRAQWQAKRVDSCPFPCKFYNYNRIVREAKGGSAIESPVKGVINHPNYL